MNHAHIDLRYVLKRLDYSGGLKHIERCMGIDRGDLSAVDGYFGVRLWYKYKRQKNERALETLLAYNCADVINLELLMVKAYNLNLKTTPFESKRQIAPPPFMPIPFQVDKKLVEGAGW